MAIDPKSEQGIAVRRLTPFNTFPGGYFETLCNEMAVQHAKTGEVLFKRDEQTTDLFYLLEGVVGLQSNEFEVEEVSATEDTSRFALAHQVPRKISAVAKTDICYIRIAADLVKKPPAENYKGESSFMITEENDGDWMTELLKSPVFQRLPAANLQKILIGLQAVAYAKGELIVAQDEPADYYYVIKSGQCALTRKPSATAKAITLAKLGVNDSFGEEALISGNLRNVSVTALTDMDVLRMEKDKFIELIKDAVLDYLSFEEIKQQMTNHVLLLDVRSADQFKAQHIENSINVPLFSLRMQLKTLNRNQKIVVICQDGLESSTAAFLLIKNKFEAAVLKDGLNSIPGFQVKAEVDFGIDEEDAKPEANETAEALNEPSEIQENDDNLTLNIDDLKKENSRLESSYSSLLQEKQQLEKENRILVKQNEKLKAVLEKLTEVG